MVELKSDYAYVVEEDNSPRKTKYFTVHSKRTSLELGTVKWVPTWRRYCYFPTMEDVNWYDARCMEDLAKFCRDLMKERKVE